MANIHSTITYNANLSAAQAQIKALTTQIGTLTAAFNTLDKSALTAQRSLAATFAAGVGQTNGFTTQTVKATSAVETFGRQLAANRLTMRQYFREAITGYTRENSLMRRLAEQQVRYQQSMAVPVGGGQAMMMTPQNINAASNAAALASQRFSVFNQLVNGGATAMLNWGKNTQWAGRQLMVGFTVPLMLFTAVASKQFRDLDKELTRFQKVYGSDLGNAISESTSRMREQVKQLAFDISSTYGIAAKETAALAADIAATGAEGEKLISGVQQTTRLSVLGEVDRQEAMKATLSLQSAFKMNTNELAESINFLNAVENQTSATLQDLSTAIPKVGPVVRSLGGDIKDLATLLVAMREGGIPAAEAANALKSGLASLINPTKQASEVAKQFGVDLVGIVEANRGQLMPTIYAMQEALSGLDSFSRSRVIEQIFGKYQFARITALFDNIGRAGSQTQSVVELASKSSTELARVANQELRILTESTAIKFQRTLEDLKNSIMPIGQVLTETLIPIFEFIGSGMKTFASFFQALPEPVKNFAKYGIAIAALAGPIIMLVGLFGNLIANGIKFGMMLTRLGARIAGIKTEKFELLTADVMAAKLGVDRLTTSFDTQEKALLRLTGVLSSYEASLRRLTTANPALFVPGAIPSARGAIPIRRQGGSDRPEFVPGSGRGDKIPAMLEPGEFIVNRAATEKYAPVLMEMNRGTLKGFQNGTGRDDFRGYEQRKLKAPIGVPLALGQNVSSAGIVKGFSSLSATPQNLIGLFYKQIAAAAGVTSKAITDDFKAWQRNNKPIIADFTKAYALAAGDAAKQRQLLKQIDDKFVADMGGAKSSAGKFALQAASMEQENTKILKRAQQILIKHGVDLNDAGQVTQFYKNNLRDLSTITDKTELAAHKLLQSLLTRGSYTDVGKILSATMPLVPGQDRKAPAIAARYRETGIPQQYIPAAIRSGSERKAFGLGFTREVQTYMKNMQLSVEHTATTLNQIGKDSANGLKNMTSKVAAEARKILGIKSPSTVVDAEAQPIGRGIAEGAINGIRKGMQSAAKRPIISGLAAGPVGAGLESSPITQKIEALRKQILTQEKIQAKFAGQRSIAIQQIYAIDAEIQRLRGEERAGRITAQERLRQELYLHEQKRIYQKEINDSLAREKFYQSKIDSTKGEIVSAEQAQLRAEQQEAKNAQRRAAMSATSMFGMGPGGSMGYLMGGVSPYAAKGKTPDWLRSRMDQAAKASKGAPVTGPAVAIGSARDQSQNGMRGMGAMNAMFALSMVTSSLSMMSGASQEATAKLGLFTTALMTASTLMMLRGSGAGVPKNFLGMGSLSNAAGAANLRKTGMAGATAAQAGQLRGLGHGKDLGKLSGALSMLGGPVGMGAAAAITGIAAAYLLVENAAEQARKRSVAAFEDPIKSAEYFGVTIADVTQQMKDLQTGIEEPIDQGIRDAVKQDYAALIEKIRFSGASAGARELSLVFNKMIASGLSAESATAAVKAIAIESGQAGGEAFATAYREGLMRSTTPKDVANNLAAQFDPELMAKNAEEIRKSIEQVDLGPMMDMAGNSAELLDNTFGDILTGVASFTSNLNQGMRFARMAITNILPEDNMFSQSINQLFDKDQAQAAIDTASNYSRTMEQLAANLAENMDISSTQMIGIVETLFSTFKDAPTESMQTFDKIAETALSFNNVEYDPVPIQEFLNTLDPIASITLSPLIQDNEELALKILKATAAGMDLQDILDAIANNRLDIEINVRIEIAEAEQELSQLRKDLSEGIEGDLEGDIERLDTRILNLTNRISNLGEKREESLEKLQENFDGEQKIREDSVEALEDELENKKEVFEEEMKALDDRQDKIEKSSDAYIESLEKNQKADSFYAQQRKTAFGALEKLASGDVFGFLQEREQMSADAQNFSYDQMISDIEERRDLELDAIEEIRDSRQEEQDEYENMMQDKINSIRDVMEIEQEAHDIAMEDEKERFDTKIENAEKELRNKRTKRKEIQDVIDAVKNDEILSNEELSKVLPPLQAKQYEQKQKEIIKSIFLIEMEKSYEEGVTQNQAVLRAAAAVRPLLEDLMPGSSAQTAEDIMGYLGASPSQTSYYGRLDVPRRGSQGNTGGSTGSTSSNNDPSTWADWKPGDSPLRWWNGSQYKWDNSRKEWVITRATGGPIKLGDGGGGKVTGPGGPKSDVIPAYLSNGEYVIQASSVSKYGKDMMDNINAGKYAYGGYISADRAEYQASQKPKYSGGTPTYTGGYNNANTQANANIYKQKNKYDIGIRGIGLTPPTNNTDWLTSFITGMGLSMRDQSVAFLSRFTSPFGAGAYSTYNANPNIGYVAPAAMTGRTQSEYADYVDAGQRDIDAALFASNFIPIPGVGPALKGAGTLLRRGSGTLLRQVPKIPRPSLVQPRVATGVTADNINYRQWRAYDEFEKKYGRRAFEYLLESSKTGKRVEGIDTRVISDNPYGKSVIDTFLEEYGFTEPTKDRLRYIATNEYSRPVRVIPSDTRDKVNPILIQIAKDAENFTTESNIGPYISPRDKFIRIANTNPQFKALSPQEKRAAVEIAEANDFSPALLTDTRLSDAAGFDSSNWSTGQINYYTPDKMWSLLSTIAHESGHSTDFAFNATGYGSFISRNTKPLMNGVLGRIQSAVRAGKTEAMAESNRLRAMRALLEDIGADPEDIVKFSSKGEGIFPYYPGIKLTESGRPASYGNSPAFKIAYALGMSRNIAGKNPYMPMQQGFSLRGSGILPDITTSIVPWLRSLRPRGRVPGVTGMPAMSPSSIVPTKDEVVRLSGRHSKIDESILDNVFGTTAGAAVGGHTPINPGGWVVGADGARRYVKSSIYGGPSVVYTEAMLAKMYRALGLEVPDVDLLTIGGKTRSYAPNRSFQPGSLVLSSREIENVKTLSQIAKIDSPLNKEMLATLNQEEGIGYAVDQLFGIKDLATNPGNYGIKYDPNNPSTLLNPVRIDLGSNVFQDAGGNLIPFDPNYALGKPKGLASHEEPPWHMSIPPGALRNQVARLQDVIESRGGIRGLLDQAVYELSQTSPTYTLGNPDFVEFVLQRRMQGLLDGEYLYANGGLVQKFADGGEALTLPNRGLPGKLSLINRNDPNAPANGGFLPDISTTGAPTAARPTSTTIGGQSGPNGWPWISSYNSGLLDTKRIPGTNVNLTMNRDVLPLFLALASDYNRTIRKISPGSGGFDPRTDRPESERAKSNHPSGTAMDINYSEEGALSDSKDLFNWWKTGKTSAGAPWKPISPQPYKTALSLKNKYKVVDWFGPTALGGYITGTPDYMHWQISQSGGVVTPQRVAQVIGELGLNADGTFNRPNTYAAGGFISGPGGPRSDMIPAMLSNGEYVVKASSVAKYGKGFMDQVNSGSLNPFQGSSLEPRMFASGGMVGSAPMPAFNMPAMADTSVGVNNTNYAGNSSSTRNSTKVNVVINGSGNKGANAIANKVISMINSANNRRNHSRSI